ncbi:MAG TPA: formylglycine-generating enzyme family protein [Acidobacteriota bacterium]|nr:formylglycine-generating enzyme family protein [Acidobacteriota bacterium]
MLQHHRWAIHRVSTSARLIGLAVLLVLLTGAVAAGTDVWASHVTAAAGWKTSIALFGCDHVHQDPHTDLVFDYTLQMYDEQGGYLDSVSGTVTGQAWTVIPSGTLNYEGSARITSTDNLVVKVAYQFGDTPSVCEFYLKDGVQNQWILPNTVRPWMDWTGLAVLNSTNSPITIALEARKDGITVGTLAGKASLEPHAKYVRVSDQIWAGVGYDDADSFVVTASAPIQAPLSITGNYIQDRHLFFAALSSTPVNSLYGVNPAGTDVWASHITAAAGWHTGLSVYNPGSAAVPLSLYRYDETGGDLGAHTGDTVAPHAWHAFDPWLLEYEGSARVTALEYLLVKVEFQYADTPSVCEFYLTGDRYITWIIPNTVRPWMDWTGLAVVNPNPVTNQEGLSAYLNGNLLDYGAPMMAPLSKYARLTNGIWSEIDYPELDTIIAYRWYATPAPISITGNTAQDRHLFFAAQPLPPNDMGQMCWIDDFIGGLLYMRGGVFIQGSPADEPCRFEDETQFTHTIARNFITTWTEVTRRMWAALQAVQPTLPADPSHLFGGDVAGQPVQNVTWYEAVLFANLLSDYYGLTPCYFKDAAFTEPVTAANYTTGSFYCDFDSPGFRLPTEGEWEYMGRAGNTGPFSYDEPNYTAANCNSASTPGMYPNLEHQAWFKDNAGGKTHVVGTVPWYSPWGVPDMHGNVWEWCWDWYATYPASTQKDYTGPESGTNRVVRGGSWGSDARLCRSAMRQEFGPDSRSRVVGFRLVRTYP